MIPQHQDLKIPLSAIELIDNLEISQKSKEQVLVPYLELVYDNLTARAGSAAEGVTLHIFTEVHFLQIYNSLSLCHFLD